jgi:hypothetical protein
MDGVNEKVNLLGAYCAVYCFIVGFIVVEWMK